MKLMSLIYYFSVPRSVEVCGEQENCKDSEGKTKEVYSLQYQNNAYFSLLCIGNSSFGVKYDCYQKWHIDGRKGMLIDCCIFEILR